MYLRNMYPRISKKGLHCGHDDSNNLSLIEKQIGNEIFYEIVCNDHGKSGNYVCDIKELMIIIEEHYEKSSLSEEEITEIINTICAQISTNKTHVSFNVKEKSLDIQ